MGTERREVCCTEVVDATQRIAVMEATDKVNKWWVRVACGFIVFCIPFIWEKLDSIETQVTQVSTVIGAHMESTDAHRRD